MVLRSPTPSELRLLDFLVDEVDHSKPSKNLFGRLKVANMNDDCMGSLRLFPDGSQTIGVHFGRRAGACQFTDEDGVEVIASLNLDHNGNLYELDIWKTDFGKLIRIPDNNDELRREVT
jgi:hypothetical protein